MDPLIAIRARRAEIARLIEALAIEDRELATTEHVLERLNGKGANSGHVGRKPAPHQRPRSQREFVLDALAHAKTPWLKTAEIIAEVKSRWGETIPELSLRPLLSTLKRSNAIVRHGRFVALRERASELRPLIERPR